MAERKPFWQSWKFIVFFTPIAVAVVLGFFILLSGGLRILYCDQNAQVEYTTILGQNCGGQQAIVVNSATGEGIEIDVSVDFGQPWYEIILNGAALLASIFIVVEMLVVGIAFYNWGEFPSHENFPPYGFWKFQGYPHLKGATQLALVISVVIFIIILSVIQTN